MGGVNQQERLKRNPKPKWGVSETTLFFLAGFTEGEGSLTVSVKTHPTAKYGYVVDPEFYLRGSGGYRSYGK